MAVAARLTRSPVSQRINTSFVERDNLTPRQQNRRLARRTNGFSKAPHHPRDGGWGDQSRLDHRGTVIVSSFTAVLGRMPQAWEIVPLLAWGSSRKLRDTTEIFSYLEISIYYFETY